MKSSLCRDDVPITSQRHFFFWISGPISSTDRCLNSVCRSVASGHNILCPWSKRHVVFLLSVLLVLFISISVFICREEGDWEAEAELMQKLWSSAGEFLYRGPFFRRKPSDWNQYHACLIFSTEYDLLFTSSCRLWGLRDVQIKHGENFQVQTSQNTARATVGLLHSVCRPQLSSSSRPIVQGYSGNIWKCCILSSYKLTEVTQSWLRCERNVSKEEGNGITNS